MSDNGSQDTSVSNGAPDNSANGGAASPGDSLESLPQSWQTHIRQLRSEGQNKGARITALETELATAKSEAGTREASLTSQLSESQMENARYRAAVTSGIPIDFVDDFASRLRGSTADELAADAVALAKHFQAVDTSNPESRRGVDPSAGRGNGDSAPPSLANQLASQVSELLGRN